MWEINKQKRKQGDIFSTTQTATAEAVATEITSWQTQVNDRRARKPMHEHVNKGTEKRMTGLGHSKRAMREGWFHKRLIKCAMRAFIFPSYFYELPKGLDFIQNWGNKTAKGRQQQWWKTLHYFCSYWSCEWLNSRIRDAPPWHAAAFETSPLLQRNYLSAFCGHSRERPAFYSLLVEKATF